MIEARAGIEAARAKPPRFKSAQILLHVGSTTATQDAAAAAALRFRVAGPRRPAIREILPVKSSRTPGRTDLEAVPAAGGV